MHHFEIEEEYTGMAQFSQQRTKELIHQISALQKFYGHLGFDSKNIRSIFKLTLDYLDQKVDKLEVTSFFEALMKQNKVLNEKELNLLVCFDGLLELHSINPEISGSEEYKNAA